MLKLSIISIYLLLFITISAQEFNAEVVSHDTKVLVSEGKLIKQYKYEIKINNRSGESYSKVSIPYSSMVDVSKIQAHLEDASGNIIRKLKRSEIESRSSISGISLYEDSFVYEFTLKHNSYPYSVIYSYEERQKEFLFIDRWIPVFNNNIPTLSARLELKIPQNYQVNLKNRLIDSYYCDTIANTVRHIWRASYTDIVSEEQYSTPILDYLPEVTIVPEKIDFYKKGTTQTWQSFGEWQRSLLEGLSDLPHEEQVKVTELVSEIDDVYEKVKILYHYLQDETRYINVTIETGGLRPYPASYVAENKYGDCKALSNYFKSILEFVNIPSFYTKVYAGDQVYKIDKSQPSQQFNHIILCVPVNNDTIWLDCTSDGPFNYLGTFTQNRNAFVVSENSKFVRTPALKKEDVHEVRKVKIYQDQQNNVVSDFKISYRGDSFEALLNLKQNFSESKRNEIIRNYIVEEGFDPINYSIEEPIRDSLSMTLLYSAHNSSLYKKYGNETLIQVLPFNIPDFEEPSRRVLSLQIDYPIFKSDILEYSIPGGIVLESALKNKTIETRFGQYKLSSYIEGDNIIVKKSFLLNAGNYSIEEYEDFYAFIDELTEIDNSYLVITNN